MTLRTFTRIAFAVGLVASNAAYAQQQAPTGAPDLNAIPEKMPFDIPYGTPITMDRAQSLVQAAVAEANKRGWKMNVAVVDPNGDFSRMDGARSLSSPFHGRRRAWLRAIDGRHTHLGMRCKFGFNYILTLDDVIASRGGIPLIEGGKIIGAIGCSGGTGSQDEATCTAAASTLNK